MKYFISLWILYFALIFIGLSGCSDNTEQPNEGSVEIVDEVAEGLPDIAQVDEDDIFNDDIIGNFDMPPSDNFEPVPIETDEDIIEWLDEIADNVDLPEEDIIEEAAPAPIEELEDEIAPEINNVPPPPPPNPIQEICPQGFTVVNQGDSLCLPICEKAAELAGYREYTLYVDKTDAVIQRWSNRAIRDCDKLNRWDSKWLWGAKGRGWQGYRDWQNFEYVNPVYDVVMNNDFVHEVQLVRARPRRMTQWYSVCCVR